MYTIKKLSILLFTCLSHGVVFAQSINPGIDDVFRPGEVATIRLTMTPEDKAFLLAPENVESEVYLSAIFEMKNSQFDTVLQIPVGIRLRGNTSRFHNKKPFKINFREFDGAKFFGYKKFNLKPNTNDPSHYREPLTLQYYREMGVPAARTHPVRVYINNEYMGIYTNVEQIDDEFLNLRYGHEEGFLYKCSWGASLVDNGQVFNALIFESEINEDDDTRAELDHFVKILDHTSDANFQTEIEKVFDVQLYLRQLAVEAVLGHWDGYSFNMNNFYLFYNGKTGKVVFIPYDADNTWGIDWVGEDWAKRDLNAWAKTPDDRPLTTRILNVPSYRQIYLSHIKTLFKEYFNEDFLVPQLNDYRALIEFAVKDDTYFDDSFGFTFANFWKSFIDPADMSNHVQYGILEFLKERTTTAADQIENLITSVEGDHAHVMLAPNPTSAPEVRLLNISRFERPRVISSIGAEIDVSVTAVDDDKLTIKLPGTSSPGLYIIILNGKTFRWIYR